MFRRSTSVKRAADEQKIHGQHACRALFARRPDDIVRAYVARDQLEAFGDLLHTLAATRRSYKVVATAELEKLTDSKHHEGICLLVKRRAARALADLVAEPGPGVVVALVDVENPHNVGAIVRSAAHFGARAVVVEGDRDPLTPSALRTAQGGAEAVEVLAAARIDGALDTCRRGGFRVCATSGREGRSLYQAPLPPRAVLLLGSERQGLPGRLVTRADEVLSIPGTGAVESLNVSVAAAVVLAELWRQRQAR